MSIIHLKPPTISLQKILVILLIGVAGFGIYYFGFRNDQNPPVQTAKPNDSVSKSQVTTQNDSQETPLKTGDITIGDKNRIDGLVNTGSNNTINQK